jgi:hypothetical protein
MKQSQKKPISDADLQKAIKKFIDGGGIIQVLPEQKTVRSTAVGHKHGSGEFGDHRS